MIDWMDEVEMDWISNRFEFDSLEDHEYIKSYQKTLSGRRQPSKEKTSYWIYAERKTGRYPEATSRSGKWLIFAPPNEIDSLWKTVSKLTRDGKLGNDSKVSTARSEKSEHVICVYTYDWKDKEDVMKIRAVLKEAGISKKIPYKTDAATLAGRYAKNGDKKISKYYE